MTFVCHSYALVCHPYVTRMYSYVLVCHPYSYVPVCHPYVTRMYSYVIHMLLICTRMSFVCNSYVLVCHQYVTHMCLYVTRMYWYVIHMTFVCGFTMNLLGDAVRKKVITEIKDTGMYCLSADTIPDPSRYDQLAVVICYAKETVPIKRLLALKHMSAKVGVATVEDIVKVFQKSTLDTSQLVSQSYDFVNNMSGEYNETQQKLQEIVSHDVPYMPCSSH